MPGLVKNGYINDGDHLNSMCMPCDTECKPECCIDRRNHPIYSCSTGCVCLNDNQYKFLLDRGGNNVNQNIYSNDTPIKSQNSFTIRLIILYVSCSNNIIFLIR